MSMSIKKFATKKVVVVTAATVLTLGIAGTAFAYFTSSGTGTGQVSTGTGTTGVVITDNSGSLNALTPGTAAQALTVTATNPTGQSAYVSGITAYVTVVENPTVAAEYPGYLCSSADYSLDGTAGSTAGAPVTITGWTAQDLAAGGGQASTAPGNTIGFNDLTAVNQDACQSATVTINYNSN